MTEWLAQVRIQLFECIWDVTNTLFFVQNTVHGNKVKHPESKWQQSEYHEGLSCSTSSVTQTLTKKKDTLSKSADDAELGHLDYNES